jgi:hypothetical protein
VTLKAAVLTIVYSQRATTHSQRTTIESAADFRPVRPEDDKRSASDDQQVTKRSAESVPPEPRGLRGRGGERPFSDCESARSAANSRERGSEMTLLKTFAAANRLHQKPRNQTKKEIVHAASCRSMNISIDSLSMRRTPR